MSAGDVTAWQPEPGVAASAPATAVPDARALRATWTLLALMVVGSAALRIVLNQLTSVPWIVPDEILYSELAKSISTGDPFTVRGTTPVALGPVYPLLLAPAWALVDDPELAYRVALSVNAVVMSLTAIPAYFLARSFVPGGRAFLVAGFAVLIPSMAYTGVLMTENAFYPAFVLFLLAVTRVLERPSAGRQLAVFGTIALLALVRVQGAALLAAYAGAVLLRCLLLERGGARRGALREFAASWAALAACVLFVPVWAVASRSSPLDWLGIYSGAFAGVEVGEIPRWLAYHLGDIVLYTGVVPAAATTVLVALALRSGASQRVRLFVAVFLPAFVATLAIVVAVSAAVDVDGREVLNERYLFYVVPLLLIGLALWIEEGLPRPRKTTAAVAAAVVALAAVIPFDELSYNVNHQALASVLWVVLELPALVTALVVAAVVGLCVAVWLRARPATSSRLWIPVVVSCLFVGGLVVGAMASSSAQSRDLGLGDQPGWIDSAVPDGETVVVLWRDPAAGDRRRQLATRVVLLNEFFNTSVGTVYNVGGTRPTHAWLATEPARVSTAGTVVDASGAAVRARYALALCDAGVVGTEVARDRATGAVLYRLPGIVRMGQGGAPCFGLYGRPR